MGGGTPYPIIYTILIPLQSESESHIDQLKCAYWGEISDRNLTLGSIKEALGVLVDIR